MLQNVLARKKKKRKEICHVFNDNIKYLSVFFCDRTRNFTNWQRTTLRQNVFLTILINNRMLDPDCFFIKTDIADF